MSQYVPKLVRIYIDSYVRVSFLCYNLGTFYARRLKLGMLLTQS